MSTAVAGVAQAHEAVHHEESFIRKYIFSFDHKTIGIQFLFTSLFMGIIGGTLALLIRLQLAWPGRAWPILGALMPNAFPNGIMRPDIYYSLVTMHGTIMVFFVFTTALVGGFANFLIPLQIGARDMAFPLLNMLSYWLYLPASIIMLSSFFVDGGAPGTGWTAYPPLSALQGAAPGTGLGQTLWLVALFLMMVSFLLGSLNYITTTLNMRAPGLSMSRLPLSVWALVVTATVSLLSFPVLLGAAVMLLADRHLGTSFYLPAGIVLGGRELLHTGGDPLLWQHLFWFLGHPEVYILILPAMGMVSEVMATHARKPIFGYRFMVGSMLAIALLSFLVWGHHMFTSGMHPLLGTAFMATTLVIAIPSAIKAFNWLATLWGGKIRFTPPMLFAIGFVSMFVTGGLTGLVAGSPPISIYFHDTYFIVAHFHFVMASAALFGLLAAVYHWFPKMFGRMMNERLGRWHFWFTFLGIYGTFFPMHFMGTAGMMRRIYSPEPYAFLADIQPLNVISTVSALVLGFSQVLFLINLFYSLFRGPKADRNPWQATTLEWLAPSPAPHGNWDEGIPEVYRWPYDYSVPGASQDYIPQHVPDVAVEAEAPQSVSGNGVAEAGDSASEGEGES
ncbi:MAG TPA: cbb3-type cytochrome c oxidase subunit I [Sphingobacteriaceae bacterium]|nr:cbb3-type cytochrome c oxidase subunit I [Sphingobacteriaceae bacterium]